jgi:hypothetical protein
MRQSPRRFFRSLCLFGWWSLVPLVTTVAIGGAIGWWLWNASATVTSLVRALPEALTRLTVWDGWADGRPGRPLVILAGALFVLWCGGKLARVGWEKWSAWRERHGARRADTRRLTRIRGTVGKWLLGVSGCAIFVFGWKPAAAIVGFLFAYAWVNWLFYHQPFLRLTSRDAVRP